MNKQGIFIAEDVGKDQSYYLSKLILWLFKKKYGFLQGIYSKGMQTTFQEFDLSNYTKKDSVGICFVENERVKSKDKISRTRIFTQSLSDYIQDQERDIWSVINRKDITKRSDQTLSENFVQKTEDSEPPGMIKVYWKRIIKVCVRILLDKSKRSNTSI